MNTFSSRLVRMRDMFVLLLLTSACGQPAPAGGPKVDGSGVRGYEHVLSRSTFQIGSLLQEADEFGMHKWIGSVGTFAIRFESRAAAGFPDMFPLERGQDFVFSLGADAQNAAVAAYFTGAGLPADQVAAVTATEAGIREAGSVTPRAHGWFPVCIALSEV